MPSEPNRSGDLRNDRVTPPSVGDNAISSIHIPEGFVVTVYADPDFQGESKTFSESVATLGDFDDKISSLTIASLASHMDDELGKDELNLEFDAIFFR